MQSRTTRQLTLLLLGVLVLAVGGCAGSKKPAWIDDPYAEIDRDEFFVAVGKGRTEFGAQQAAMEELAKEVRPVSQLPAPDLEEYQRRMAQAGGDATITTELLRLSTFDLARPYIGAKAEETYYDKRSTTYFARGTINRATLVSTYDNEMRLNRQMANRMIEKYERETTASESNVSTLRLFAILRTAMITGEVYNHLRHARGRLAGSAIPIRDETLLPPKISDRELRQIVADLRATISASIESEGATDTPMQIETEVKQALQALGVPVRTDSGEGHVRILVNFDVEPAHEHRADIKLARWQVTIEVVEDKTGRSMRTLAFDDKTGGRTYDDAVAEAGRLARAQVDMKIQEFLRGAMFEQSVNVQ